MKVFVVIEQGCEGGFMAVFKAREVAERFAARWNGRVVEASVCSSFEEGETEYFGEGV